MGKLADMLDNIESTLSAAASLDLTQSYDELKEGIPETPLLQIYPAGVAPVSRDSQTDRKTFGGMSPGGGVTQETVTVHGDLFVSQRKLISQEMRDLVVLIEELQDILRTQPKNNLFGDPNIMSFTWQWHYASFEYSGADYVGAKFIIEAILGN